MNRLQAMEEALTKNKLDERMVSEVKCKLFEKRGHEKNVIEEISRKGNQTEGKEIWEK